MTPLQKRRKGFRADLDHVRWRLSRLNLSLCRLIRAWLSKSRKEAIVPTYDRRVTDQPQDLVAELSLSEGQYSIQRSLIELRRFG